MLGKLMKVRLTRRDRLFSFWCSGRGRLWELEGEKSGLKKDAKHWLSHRFLARIIFDPFSGSIELCLFLLRRPVLAKLLLTRVPMY